MNPKFRWFYIPEKLMIYPDTSCDHLLRLLPDGIHEAFICKGDGDIIIPSKDFIGPMFCIGLKDKKKNDIYANDIMDYEYAPGVFPIRWDQEHCCFTGWGCTYCDFQKHCTVIGNEIMHPELLEET